MDIKNISQYNMDFFNQCFDKHNFEELNNIDVGVINKAIQLFTAVNKNKSPLFFDVGTNSGSFIKVIQSYGFNNVHCFEPQPNLSQTVIEKYPYVKMNTMCLSDYCGTINITFPKYSVGLSSVINRPVFKELESGGQECLRVDVPTTTIDNYCSVNNIDIIDFIKIDVEGAEKMVLDGASEMLKNGNIKMGLFEVGETLKDAGTCEDEICNMLKSYGYNIVTKIPMNYLFYKKV
jgi:FkbM family methyltransferase